MASSQDDSEWDKSTSEIQSEDSEDLFESRPNRWRGPPQSWRTLTEEDRLTSNALERLRNQDLSVHLYNAFALKTTPIAPNTQGVDAESQPQSRQPETWAPPKSWTAWPLRVDLVPPDDFIKRTEDEDEALTFRTVESKVPSKQLEEVVSAAILRFAKEKFRKRQLDEPLAPAYDTTGVKNELIKDEPVSSGVDSALSEAESGEEKEKVSGARSQHARGKTVEKTYKPAVATDDDVSYEIIRPSTRAILSKIDQTLTILHEARASSYRGPTDSAASSSEAEDDIYDEATPSGRRSRSRTTPRSRPTSRASSVASSIRASSRSLSRGAIGSPTKPKTNRGRKAAAVPMEGESERDFLRRRAKELKKRRPAFSDEETNTAAEGVKSPRKRDRRQTRARRGDGDYWTQKKLDRLNLRDWSDVMGAAALAGFDARVIERATQRCANLFGQGMEMHTINEDTGVKSRRYVPGQAILSTDAESEDDDDEEDDGHQTAPSRAISLAASDWDEHEEERSGTESPQKRQKRNSSRGSLIDVCYCHHADCERNTRSFDRLGNLKRHLRLVHGEDGGQEGNTTQSEHEGADRDLYYCTHADCERATRPFDKGHNLKRHLMRVHGEGTGGSSKTIATAQHFCPHVDCERATQAFRRRPNLNRHLTLVHGAGDSTSPKPSLRTGQGKEVKEVSIPHIARQNESSNEKDSELSEDESSTESESDPESE